MTTLNLALTDQALDNLNFLRSYYVERYEYDVDRLTDSDLIEYVLHQFRKEKEV